MSLRHQLPAAAFVQNGDDVPVRTHRHFVNGVFDGVAGDFQRGFLFVRRLAGPEIIHGEADGRGRRRDRHQDFPVRFLQQDLGFDPLPVRPEDPDIPVIRDPPAHPRKKPIISEVDLDDVVVPDRYGIENQHRKSFCPRVHRSADPFGGLFHGRGELVLGEHQVVPGEGIDLLDAGAGQVVMELVPDEAFIGVAQHIGGVRDGAQPVGHDGAGLGGIAELLRPAVQLLVVAVGCIDAGSMDIHQQFPVVNGKDILAEQVFVVLEDIGHGSEAQVVVGAALPDARIDHAHGNGQRGAAPVPCLPGGAGAVVAHGGADGAAADHRPEFVVIGEVFPEIGRILPAVHHGQDPAAVHALPLAELERPFPPALVEGLVSPLKFLGMEGIQSAVSRDGREGIAETEAVREHDVDGLHPEFLLVEGLAQQEVADVGFHGRDVPVVGVPAAGRIPPARRHIRLHLLIGLGIIFLHPLVFHRALETELVPRVRFHQMEVLVQRVGEVFPDGLLHRPEPLGIQVGIGGHIDFALFILGVRGGRSKEDDRKQEEFFHGKDSL